ncbi:kinase-like protein [Neolentinus lepideus HHB14362 ss-1]|uniref:Kinase-like protein n=1 Tax=Neolentinus lepideus HHB14362 ss-1 TaxID=1314782 RepID=A0A165QUP4_9AGAM|nr:kinase-like protein [Neolentinus lepideus HHB14362 ss-1]
MKFTINVKWLTARWSTPKPEASLLAIPSTVKEDKSPETKEQAIVHAPSAPAPIANPEFEVFEAVYEAQVSPEVLNVHADMCLRLARSWARIAAEKLEDGDKLTISVSRRSSISSEKSYGSMVINTREPFLMTDLFNTPFYPPVAASRGQLNRTFVFPTQLPLKTINVSQSFDFVSSPSFTQSVRSFVGSLASSEELYESFIVPRLDPLRRENQSEDVFGPVVPGGEVNSSFMNHLRNDPLRIRNDSISDFTPDYSISRSCESTTTPSPSVPLYISNSSSNSSASTSSEHSNYEALVFPRPAVLRSIRPTSIVLEPVIEHTKVLPEPSPLHVTNHTPNCENSVAPTIEDDLTTSASSFFLSSGEATRVASEDDSAVTLVATAPVDLIKDYETVKQLGSGAFGTVYCVRNNISKKFSAVKIVAKKIERDSSKKPLSTLAFFVKEQAAAKIVGDHPCVIRLEASWTDRDMFYLMTPFYPGGDLGMHIGRFGRFTEERVLALEHLHAHKIIHRDVKPANILLDAAGNAVLADLGLAHVFKGTIKVNVEDVNATIRAQQPYWFAKQTSTPDNNYNPGYDHAHMCYEVFGSEPYMAPEMLADKPYSFNVDIWALGVAAFEMRCNRMLHKKPQFRATTSDLKTHSFFKGINWKKLAKGKAKAPYVPAQCTSLPRNYRPVRVPLGEAYAPGEDPAHELTFRSPRLDNVPEAQLFASSSSDSVRGIGGTVANWIMRKLIAPKPKRKPTASDGRRLSLLA